LKYIRFYLFYRECMHVLGEGQRERESQADPPAECGARLGARSHYPGIMT